MSSKWSRSSPSLCARDLIHLHLRKPDARHHSAMVSTPMKDRVDELKGKVMRRSHEEVPASPAAAPAAADDFAARLKPDWGTRKRIATLVELLSEEDINELIDKVTRMNGAQRIIKRYHPQATWLWRQWHGTVLEQTWQPAAVVMILSALVCSWMELWRTWPVLAVPDEKHTIVSQLRGLNNMWGYLLTMAGFVNSFFLSQACAQPPPSPERRAAQTARVHSALAHASQCAGCSVVRRWLLARDQG